MFDNNLIRAVGILKMDTMTINNLCYFDPNVWGTVSDWAIFIVTATTGLLVWWTLKSQTAVQNYQLEDLKLERRRFSINPSSSL